MPFPLVAHQGLAAPALLVRRWRLDGVALLAGTIAPDLPYALDRTRFDFDSGSHSLPALVWLCAPVALGTAWVFRTRVAAPLAAHLPDAGPLRLRDLGHPGSDRYPVWMTAVCGMAGGLTHLVADGFTHPERWATDRAPWLLDRVDVAFVGPDYRPTYWYDVVGTVTTIAGVLAVLLCLWLTARRRARAALPRPTLPVPTVESYRYLWLTTAAGALLGLLAAAVVWGPETRAQGTMLFTVITAAALTVGCIKAAAAMPVDP